MTALSARTRAESGAGPVRVTENRRRRLSRAYGPGVLGVLGILGALVTWEVFSAAAIVNPRYLPPPTVVIPHLVQNLASTEFWQAVGQTLRAWILGVVISTSGAMVAGLVIGSSRFLRRATHSTIEFLRPIPAVALIPLAALIFGPRLGSELLIVIYACFWIVVIQVLYGIADIDKVANDTVRTMRMSYLQRARHLVFPTVLPYLVTGVRLAATVALILSISVELIIGTPGVGHEVAVAQINDSPPQMYSLILTAGGLGIAINSMMRFVARKVLFWHESIRLEGRA